MRITGARVVVTGGAGFIGSHLVDCLLAAGNDVYVLDDFSTGSRVHLKEHSGTSRLHVHNADVRDEHQMTHYIAGADFVFHLATRNVRLSLVQPTVVHEVNATGTLNVLKAAAAARVRRFLYCSSSEVNGTAAVVPMPEEHSYRPETIYDASKLAGEYYTAVFQRSGWLSTVIARPHTNYGPREHLEGTKGEAIPRFILSALAGKPLTIYGSGTQTRDFTYVVETAEMLVRLLECDRAVGQTVNVCRGQPVSILEIATLIKELTGSLAPTNHLPGRPGDVLHLQGDPGRLKSILGVGPEKDIRAGLTETIAWFRRNVSVTEGVLAALTERTWDGQGRESWLSALSGTKKAAA